MTSRLPPADGADPHFEMVHFDTTDGRKVRAWHSPDRWAQVAAQHLPELPHAVDDDDAEIDSDASTGTLRQLMVHGGVLRVPASGRPHRALLVGTGVLARAVATAILDVQGIDLALVLPDATARRRAGVISGPTRWQADLLARTDASRVGAVRTDPGELWTPGSLVVVASETVEPDRELLARLTRRGADHVVVTAHRDRAAVGPWVTADSEACVNCRDHLLAQGDDDYSAVLAHLCRRPAVVRPVVARWAAATLAIQLLRPDGGHSSLAGLSLVGDLADPDARDVQWARHPRCTCHTAGAGVGQERWQPAV